jgi:hypothetical protein
VPRRIVPLYLKPNDSWTAGGRRHRTAPRGPRRRLSARLESLAIDTAVALRNEGRPVAQGHLFGRRVLCYNITGRFGADGEGLQKSATQS